jgi:hypothetical protein
MASLVKNSGMLQDRQLHKMCQCLALGHTGVQGRRWQKPAGCNRGPPVRRPSVAVVCMGDASVGWGGPGSRCISAPVSKLKDFLGSSMVQHTAWLVVDPLTCTGCLCTSTGPVRHMFTLLQCTWAETIRQGPFQAQTVCAGGGSTSAPERLQAQLHDVVVAVDGQRQHVPLVLYRDVNAARVLTARGVAQLVPAVCMQWSKTTN